jgi:hypothetical protein
MGFVGLLRGTVISGFKPALFAAAGMFVVGRHGVWLASIRDTCSGSGGVFIIHDEAVVSCKRTLLENG